MTVRELMEQLSNMNKDSKVVITMTCDNDFRNIHEVRTCLSGLTIIESHDVPDFDDLFEIAKETYEEHMRKIDEMEKKIESQEECMMSPIFTYERGFLKGLAAKSELILNINGQ